MGPLFRVQSDSSFGHACRNEGSDRAPAARRLRPGPDRAASSLPL